MPIATTAAIVGGAALLGAGTSVIAANKNKNAIAKSTDANLQAQRESIASQEKIAQQQMAAQLNALNTTTGLQRDAFNSSGQTQADLYNQRNATLQPWAAGGGEAFNAMNSMLGLGTQKFSAPKQVTFTPIAAPPPTTSTPTGTPATPAAAFNPTSFANIEALMTDPQYRALNTADRRDARREFQGVL
jgi:hypothetical protein